MKELRILAFTNGTASHVWRFDPLVRRFNKRTKHQMFVTTHDNWNGEIVGANLIILEMIAGHHIVQTCRNMGAKIIYEADDATVDTYGKDRQNLQHIGEKSRSTSLQTIRQCDALTVTTQELADNYARFTDKPIYVLPILMDYEYYQEAIDKKPPRRNTDEVRIGWFGSRGHLEDLKMMLPALEKVMNKYKNARLVYAGYGGVKTDSLAHKAIHGNVDVFDKIPDEQKEFYSSTEEYLWPLKHRTLDIDIGLCPLIDDEFNRSKCPTKWFEFSVLETASICSPTVYGKVVKQGKTGLLADTVDDWEKSLSLLIEDKNLRTRLGRAAVEDVRKNYNIESEWRKWEKVYLEVLNS